MILLLAVMIISTTQTNLPHLKKTGNQLPLSSGKDGLQQDSNRQVHGKKYLDKDCLQICSWHVIMLNISGTGQLNYKCIALIF
jgi:hypothetical protein